MQTLSDLAVCRTDVLAQVPPDPVASFFQHRPVACDPWVSERVGGSETTRGVSVEQLHRPDEQNEQEIKRYREIAMRYDIGVTVSLSLIHI